MLAVVVVVPWMKASSGRSTMAEPVALVLPTGMLMI